MIYNVLLSCVLLVIPLHDFHTTILNLTYQDDKKTFSIDLRLDTEHIEYVLNKTYDVKLNLGESNEDPMANQLLEDYLNTHIRTQLNGRTINLKIEQKEVNFADTYIHFKAFGFKKKLKEVKMHNSFMINDFPSQKNLVKVNYKGISKNMLFDLEHADLSVQFP